MIRFLDIILSAIGLILLFPLFLLLSLVIFIDSGFPIFYKQIRVGKDEVDFMLYKFRTMSPGSDKGRLITVGDKDHRITRSGYFLRKYKLDEIPQLLNVLKGDMSFVGPRPEVRKYVDLYSDVQKEVLKVRPGITDYASIIYVDENNLLSHSLEPEKTYISDIMPKKIELNMKYIANPTLSQYFTILFLTFFRIFR
jgi:lipopolysaccharide/colanic/teichoic acid biosynthesis glycosyltransferase